MRFRVTFAVDWSELPQLIESTSDFNAPDVEVLPDEPKVAKTKAPKKRSRGPVADTSLGKLVLELFADGKDRPVEQVAARLQSAGYKPTSAVGACSSLVKEGHLVRREKGVYRVSWAAIAREGLRDQMAGDDRTAA